MKRERERESVKRVARIINTYIRGIIRKHTLNNMLRVRNGTATGPPRSRRKSKTKKFAINDENDLENVGARSRRKSKMGGLGGSSIINMKKSKSARKPLGSRSTNRVFGDITNRQGIKKGGGGGGGMVIKKKPRFKIVIDNENEPPPIEYAPVSRPPVNDCIFDDQDCPKKIVQSIFEKKSKTFPDRIELEETIDITADFGLDEPIPPLDDLQDDDNFSFPWEE